MAHNNVEVEIKIPLSKKEFLRIKKLLEKSAKFIRTSNQKDTYFTPIHRSFLKVRYPYEWLSVRERSGKVILNYKHWYPAGAKFTEYADEYETEVKDSAQIEKILKAVRFTKAVMVEKKRLVYEFKGKFEIALDEVKNLGFFIEIESLKDLGGPQKTHKAILEFAHTLGLYQTKTVPGGYAAQLLRKKGLLK